MKKDELNKNNEKEDKDNKSVSIVDEFNRNKRLFKKLKFKQKDKDFLWMCLLETFKKTFKINRELELGLKFSLKTGAVHSNYEIETFKPEKNTIQIKWQNGNDKYWLKFYLRKKYIGSGCIIRATEHIYRSSPFWGLQDTAGLMWMKKNFKIEMKRLQQSINIVASNDGVVPDNLDPYKDTKFINKTFIIKQNQDLSNLITKYFKLKSNIFSNRTFTSKINKNSITYNVEKINDNEFIIFWKQGDDEYKQTYRIKGTKVYIKQSICSIWDVKWRSKYRLIKKNFVEFVKDVKNQP